jgi:hypothetical protein
VAVDDMTTSAHWQRMWDNKVDWTWGAADGAGSRLAPNGFTYWFWGDTILGYPNPADTSFDSQRIMVSNTIMMQRGAELGPAVYGNGTAAVPDQVMDEIERRFWTTDIIFPTMYPSKCFVLCQRIHGTIEGFIPDGAMIAEFDILSTGMLRYVGLHETPTTLVDELDELEIQWAQGWEELNGYIYIYGFNTRGAEVGYMTPNRTYVARVPTRWLTNKYAWQFWTGTGWIAGRTPTALEGAKARAKDILDGQLTSVRYDPVTERWLFANKPWSAYGDTVQIHASAEPQGPLVLKNTYASPGGMSPGGNAYVTYNPTLHPRITLLSGQYLLAISHNGDFAALFDERNLYKPEFVEVAIPF